MIAELLIGGRVLVVGDLMLDAYLWGHPTRISPESPVMVVQIDRETAVPGGAANVANNVLALGGQAIVAGVVGEDREGESLTSLLQSAGAVAIAVTVDPSRPTTTKTRLVAQSQQLMRFDREVTHQLTPEVESAFMAQLKGAIADCDVVLASDYDKGVLTENVARYLVDKTTELGIPLVVNAKPARVRSFAGATLVSLNRMESLPIIGETSGGPTEHAMRLRTHLGVTWVVLTLGADGLVLAGAEGAHHVAARPVAVYDVAGAGDTVVTVMALALAKGTDMLEAARLASHAASLVVGKLGVATATLDELVGSA